MTQDNTQVTTATQTTTGLASKLARSENAIDFSTLEVIGVHPTNPSLMRVTDRARKLGVMLSGPTPSFGPFVRVRASQVTNPATGQVSTFRPSGRIFIDANGIEVLSLYTVLALPEGSNYVFSRPKDITYLRRDQIPEELVEAYESGSQSSGSVDAAEFGYVL